MPFSHIYKIESLQEMASSPERNLAELMIYFLAAVAEMDITTAKTHCDNLSSWLFNKDGTQKKLQLKTKNSEDKTLYIEMPNISIYHPSLLYPSEVSFEITGSDAIRVYGEKLRDEKTELLCLEGQELRKATAELGYNTDITIKGQGNETRLKFTIYKHCSTMTKYMEQWLEHPTQEVKPTLYSDNQTKINK